jgi:hypothetical protein
VGLQDSAVGERVFTISVMIADILTAVIYCLLLSLSLKAGSSILLSPLIFEVLFRCYLIIDNKFKHVKKKSATNFNLFEKII